MNPRLIEAICYYLRRVSPHGPVEADELYRLITELEALLDGAENRRLDR